MPIGSITFVKPGTEPVRVRNTQSKQAFDRVMAEVKGRNWTGEQPIVISFPFATSKAGEAAGLARKVKQYLDESKYDVYTAKDELANYCVIRKANGNEPEKPRAKKK